MGECVGESDTLGKYYNPFNTYVAWPTSEGHAADHYIITIVRAGKTLTKTFPGSMVQCAAQCAAPVAYTVSEVTGFTPELDWSTEFYDHTEWTTPAHTGIAIYLWMMNATLTLQSCSAAGNCSKTVETSLDLGVMSGGQRACEAATGTAPPYNPPTPKPPLGSPR